MRASLPTRGLAGPAGLALVLAALPCGSVGCKGSGGAESDAGDPDAGPTVVEALPNEAGAAAPLELHALGFPTPVMSAPEMLPRDREKAAEVEKATGLSRLGYLRKGAKVAVKSSLLKKGNCSEGWYELVTGGYVCGKYATLDGETKDLKTAPHAPFDDRPLPYDYGLNLTNGAPLYRRMPLKKERADAEKALAVGKGASSSDVAKKLKESGQEVPAYLNVGEDGKGKASFQDLKGESGLVVERMLRGFYLALDQRVSAPSGAFWRTTLGYHVAKDHLIVHKGKTEFEGVKVGDAAETRKLPLAWVVHPKAWRYHVEEGRAKRTENVDRFTIVSLTGKKETRDERVYFETTEGFWVKDIDVAVAREQKPPPEVGAGEKWVDVDITNQTLVAYEGTKAVYATIVSTGRHDKDPAKDHTTVQGSFRVREKHVTDTMDDDAASDGTYRIEDVPWVMYFEKSYAMHGAFWHANFGRERSHGCVNLQPADARQIFQWVGPTLPAGWHGVRSTKANPGSVVNVHK